VGESGCGKSTCGRSILRLIEAASGEIVLDRPGHPRADRAACAARGATCRWCFRTPSPRSTPIMRLRDQVAEPIQNFGLASGAELDDRSGTSSTGCACRAISSAAFRTNCPAASASGSRLPARWPLNPKLIVADEAVSALDVSVQAQVLNLMMDLQADLGLSYLFISHDMAVVERVAHQVAVMYLGRIVEIGPRAAVFEARATPIRNRCCPPCRWPIRATASLPTI
jgi:ABC-type glutathione transport system ATPase component